MIKQVAFNVWKRANVVGCDVTCAAIEKFAPLFSSDVQRDVKPLVALTREMVAHFDRNIHSYGEWISYIKSPEFNSLFVKHYRRR